MGERNNAKGKNGENVLNAKDYKCHLFNFKVIAFNWLPVLILTILVGFIFINYYALNNYIYTYLILSFIFEYAIIFKNKISSIKSKNGLGNLLYIVSGFCLSGLIIGYGIASFTRVSGIKDNIFVLLPAVIINEINIVLFMLETSNSIFQNKKKINMTEEIDLLSPKPSFDNPFIMKSLVAAISNDSCYNIAIDGKFASGKSTAINELISNNENDYVRCSLGTFENNNSENLGTNIIGKVLDCILIKKKICPNYFVGGLVTVLIYSVFMMILPIIKFELNITNFIFLSITITTIFYLITLIFTNIKSGKISLLEYSIEFETNNNDNRKKINDIINLLRKYKRTIVIIFEDLDRFNAVSLFSELRELNSILNNTLANKVVFIYALDTSLFVNGENRTKFFDLIIPIIPRLAHETAMNFLESKGLDISPNLLTTIVKSTTNIRELTNICNEFVFIKHNFFMVNEDYYKNKTDKIFFMVALKNLFPLFYENLFEIDNFLDKIYKNCIGAIYENDVYKNSQNNPLDYFISYVYSNMNQSLKRIVASNKISPVLFSAKIREGIELINKKLKKPYIQESIELIKLENLINAALIFGYIGMDYKEFLTPIRLETSHKDDLNRRAEMYEGIVNLNYVFKFPYKILVSLGDNMFLQKTILNYSLISELYKRKSIISNKFYLFKQTFIRPANNFYDSKPVYSNKYFIKLIKVFASMYIETGDTYDKEFLLDVAYNKELKTYLNGDNDLHILATIMNLAMDEKDKVDTKRRYIDYIVERNFILKQNDEKKSSFFKEFTDENLIEMNKVSGIFYKFVDGDNEYNQRIFSLNLFDLTIESIKIYCNDNNIDDIFERLLINDNKDIRVRALVSNIAQSNDSFIISIEKLIKLVNDTQIKSDNFFDKFLSKLDVSIDDCSKLSDVLKNKLRIFIVKKCVIFNEKNNEFFKGMDDSDERKRLYCYVNLENLLDNEIITNSICEYFMTKEEFVINTEIIKRLIESNKIDINSQSNSYAKREKLLEYANIYDMEFNTVPLDIYYKNYRKGEKNKFPNLNLEDIYYNKISNEFKSSNYFTYQTFVTDIMPNYKLTNYKLEKKQ